MSVGKRDYFKSVDFIGLFNSEWHGQKEVGNIAILVLRRDHEKRNVDGMERIIKWFCETSRNNVSTASVFFNKKKVTSTDAMNYKFIHKNLVYKRDSIFKIKFY